MPSCGRTSSNLTKTPPVQCLCHASYTTKPAYLSKWRSPPQLVSTDALSNSFLRVEIGEVIIEIVPKAANLECSLG